MSEIDEATIEQIESVPGLRTALEVLGEANRQAVENGRCVIEFYVDDQENMTISDVTTHVRELEANADAE